MVRDPPARSIKGVNPDLKSAPRTLFSCLFRLDSESLLGGVVNGEGAAERRKRAFSGSPSASAMPFLGVEGASRSNALRRR